MFNNQDFSVIAKFAKDKAGLYLESDKEYLLESRLKPILAQFNLKSYAELAQEIQKNNMQVHKKVIESLTTNETSFFRDLQPFTLLQQKIFPELVEKRKNSRELNIWCAAASTGQEPYTVGMVLSEHFPQVFKEWKVNFVATDINQTVLNKAQSGVYSQLEVSRGLPAPLLVKYFTKKGIDWIIREDLRHFVSFTTLNLMAPLPFSSFKPFDLVFIRNVLIYFELKDKQAILERIKKVMAPDSHLFLGSSETTLQISNGFEQINHGRVFTYQPKKN